MKGLHIGFAAAGLILFAAQTAFATEQEVLRDGKDEYQTYCVACHGEKGKGDGRMADLLLVKPADLTAIAENNDGVFPFWKVYGIIEGTIPVKGHFYMPEWKNRFRADEQKPGYARSYLRILTLTLYLQTLQQE